VGVASRVSVSDVAGDLRVSGRHEQEPAEALRERLGPVCAAGMAGLTERPRIPV
jgi:hypothetical protein